MRFTGHWTPFFSRILLFGLLAVSFLSACLSSDFEIKPEDDGTPSTTVVKLNKNVSGLRDLAEACIKADSIAVFNIEYNDDGSVLYWLSMKAGGDTELYSEIVSEELRVPELSMKREGNQFYWTVNGAFLKDSKGERISVTDPAKPISFILRGESILCKVRNTVVGEFPVTRADYLARDVAFDYDLDKRKYSFHLSSGYSGSLPTISAFHLLEEKVLNRSFYKDVFLDAGLVLTSRKSLAAASYLGLSLEGVSLPYSKFTEEDRALQTAIITGEPVDLNGRLLYPDGQPRYRLLFVNGGTSTSHGSSLGVKGVENMRVFVENGGSYVGTCAGAFLVSNGYDGKADYPFYISAWPGISMHTELHNNRFGMFIEEDSPLLQYYDFGGDHYVDSIRHNNGAYPMELLPRTEVLARYNYPKKESVHLQPSIWAYKKSAKSGRVVMEGSHPEEVKEGERRDLTAAMMLYALDGVGVTTLKGYLKNGEERVMNKKSTDNKPDYTCIGDLQTHHFAAYIPSDAKNVRVELKSSSDCDLALMMSQDSFAFADVAEYSSSVPGANQKLSFPTIREGLWFIAVQCLTTVTVTETDYGQAYSGKTEVLNGVPYKIMISWE
jgi:hypothetical protein